MPFTFAHPAIVLPLLRKNKYRLSATGLLVGSVAPDFESFIRLTETKIYGHSWKGMFWFDMPLAFLLAMLFHIVVRDPLIRHLPTRLQVKFQQYVGFDWWSYIIRQLPIFLLSLFIGIFSHLVWDGFTHLNLRYPDSIASRVKLGRFRLYIILQYLCSVVGLVIVGWSIYKLPRKPLKYQPSRIFTYWLFVLLVAILFFAYLVTTFTDNDGGHSRIWLIVVSISASLTSLLIVSAVTRIIDRQKQI